ncbi:HTH domain-containing protein, partial [Escherichia coli]|nr:HTH domain-containing protein [Escherichia coli]
QQFLADQLSVTTRTIRNWVSFLEENNCLVKIPISGKICAYALAPAEVWKGYNTSKPYAAFVTKTLVNSEGVIKRRL